MAGGVTRGGGGRLPSPFIKGRGTEGEGFFYKGRRSGIDKIRGVVAGLDKRGDTIHNNLTPFIPLHLLDAIVHPEYYRLDFDILSVEGNFLHQ